MVRKITPTSGGWLKSSSITDPHRAFEKKATRALATLPAATTAWRHDTINHLLQPLKRRQFSSAILAAFRAAAHDLVELETPSVPENTRPRSALDAVTYRARLRGLLTFRTNADQLLRAWSKAITHIFREIAEAIPDTPRDALALNATVPFIVLAPAPVDLVADIVANVLRFAHDDHNAVVPGASLARRVKENVLNVSKITDEAARKNPHRITSPQHSGLTGEALLSAYLSGTPFYTLLTTPMPFIIPRKTYAEHGTIFAKSGHGKTQTLRSILANFLQEQDPPALFVMDSLGSLIEDVDKLNVFSTRLKDRLVILDPTDDVPPALNLFKIFGSNSLYHYLFKSIDNTLTMRQTTMISNLMLLMQEIPGATLETLIKVCETRENLFPDALERLPSVAKSFLINQVYCKKPDELVMKTKSQVVQRIYAIAGMGKFNEMFSAPENKFDAYRCMQEKKIVLINTDARDAEVGGLGEASPVFGRFILAQCLAAARRRPKHARHLALIICDEAKHYMDEHAALILSDARQYGLGMLLATPVPASATGRSAARNQHEHINKNDGARGIRNRLAVCARYVLDTRANHGHEVSYHRSHAEWMTYVANLTDRAVMLSVPFWSVYKMPRMDTATHAALRAANMARYGAGTGASKTKTPHPPPTPSTTSRTANVPATPPSTKSPNSAHVSANHIKPMPE